LGWQGNSEDVNYKIGENGQLTTDMKRARGIQLTDNGYFGKGPFFPSTFILLCLTLALVLPFSALFWLFGFPVLSGSSCFFYFQLRARLSVFLL
jgi:hypothetical protein